ncbi:MAG: hypothetical protein Q4D16_21965 [Eubacteriales bacterium]|nr:hypothetical protein [Eubacteriales bacterium]
MVILTQYGNFATFKDLRIFMISEGIDSVTVETDYWGIKLPKQTLTLSEVDFVINAD